MSNLVKWIAGGAAGYAGYLLYSKVGGNALENSPQWLRLTVAAIIVLICFIIGFSVASSIVDNITEV